MEVAPAGDQRWILHRIDPKRHQNQLFWLAYKIFDLVNVASIAALMAANRSGIQLIVAFTVYPIPDPI